MIYLKITGNPRSSKNSRPIFINKTTGNRFVGKSKALKDYMDNGLAELFLQAAKIRSYYYKNLGGFQTILPIVKPCEITFQFYVKDKRKYDLVNLMQCPLDLLKQAGIIADDNYFIVESLDGSRINIDKNNPRTEINIKILGR